MSVLALETSTEVCSVALLHGGQVVTRQSEEPRAHAKLLQPMIDQLMAQAGLRPAQLSAVGFACGPGSFTGVRIATAAAQAIAFAADIPAVPVSTLAVVAQRAWRQSNTDRAAVAMDARMGEVYWGCYQLHGKLMRLAGEQCVVAPGAVVKPDGDNWTAVGSGWSVHGDELSAASGVSASADIVSLPNATDILPHALALLESGQSFAAEDAIPVYLRNNVAQTEAERKRNSTQ